VTHPGQDNETPPGTPPARGGLGLKIAAGAAIVLLAGVPAVNQVSAAYDEVRIPIGNLATMDGLVSGTVRINGDRLIFYSGDRFQSTSRALVMNFVNGGSLVLCPHSKVQILTANQNSGVMLAFQDGGSEQPFPVHPSDVVMTPDWRIEMLGNVHAGDTGVLQLSTSYRGDLCLTSSLQSGAYFHVTQLAGNAAFNLPRQGSVRISNRSMQPNPEGCSCNGVSTRGAINPVDSSTPSPSNVANTQVPPAVSADLAAQPVSPASNPPATAPSTNPVAQGSPTESAAAKPTRQHQRPQDVVGYVRSFVHLLFGR
jgi:hypothetical protein